MITTSTAYAGRIEKAFEALKEFNYFKAKALFEKSIKKNESPASYGLSLIFYRNDNPFHSLDSAFVYVLRAESSYANLKEKSKVKYKEIGFDYLNIIELRSKISTGFFERVQKLNTIDAYAEFVEKHPWSNELFTAIYKRDSLAFEVSKISNTSVAYADFMQKYPESSFYAQAQQAFFRTQYSEYTKSNQLVAFLEFLKKCPDNPLVLDAENRIYEIVVAPNNVDAYASFIAAYPKNRNIGDAWRKLYQLFMVDFSEDRIDHFKKEFPNYPYWDELEADSKYLQLKLLPYKKDNLFGYMDYSGQIIIGAEYEQLGFFKEGIALAMKNGLYGYIDKGNRVLIPFQYESGTDFEQGRAIVEKDGKVGMIDRNGSLIFPLAYEDLGNISDGLIYAKKDSLYGYYDKNSNVRITPKFNEAFSFSDSIAKVEVGGNQGFIDVYGTFVVPPGYSEIRFFNDSLLIFQDENELFGLMRKSCQIVVSAQYKEIGELTLNRAIVVKENGMLGYMDGSGKEVIPTVYELFPNYQKRGQFTSNFAVVKQKGKFGLIDKDGKVILPLNLNELGDFGALMAFSKGKGWGFMDMTGKVILSPEFDYAESFQDGLAIVEKLTLQGLIDPKGTAIIPITFTSIDRIAKDIIVVSTGSKFGVYNNKGELLVPVEYQQIRLLDKDFLLLLNNNEVHYLYLPEKRIIQPLLKGE